MASFKARLSRMSVFDYLHRGFVFSLVGIAGYGIFMMGAIHFDTMRRGKGASPPFSSCLCIRFVRLANSPGLCVV